MYERMLDKQHCPSLEEMSAFCEENALRRQERSACAAHERELNEQDFRRRTGRRSRKRAR